MQRKKRTLRLDWKIPILLILGLSLLNCDDAESIRQLDRLRHIAADTPTFSDFREVRSSYNNKLNNALLSLCYNSAASYDEVKTFYSTTLMAKGWGSPEERTVYGSFGLKEKKDSRDLVFRKGEYSISIAYGPKDSSGCNYAISYIWEK